MTETTKRHPHAKIVAAIIAALVAIGGGVYGLGETEGVTTVTTATVQGLDARVAANTVAIAEIRVQQEAANQVLVRLDRTIERLDVTLAELARVVARMEGRDAILGTSK